MHISLALLRKHNPTQITTTTRATSSSNSPEGMHVMPTPLLNVRQCLPNSINANPNRPDPLRGLSLGGLQWKIGASQYFHPPHQPQQPRSELAVTDLSRPNGIVGLVGLDGKRRERIAELGGVTGQLGRSVLLGRQTRRESLGADGNHRRVLVRIGIARHGIGPRSGVDVTWSGRRMMRTVNETGLPLFRRHGIVEYVLEATLRRGELGVMRRRTD
mmetsp:Transcript_109/g.154  ORF Transcript_109/g.154 Transcript_109/m.154 type:complete len:216 (+) Transcript_109:412-1059(+)